jgi:hypothetical protein
VSYSTNVHVRCRRSRWSFPERNLPPAGIFAALTSLPRTAFAAAAVECGAGQHLVAGKCVACPLNTWARTGDNICTKCKAGTASPGMPPPAAVPCHAGSPSQPNLHAPTCLARYCARQKLLSGRLTQPRTNIPAFHTGECWCRAALQGGTNRHDAAHQVPRDRPTTPPVTPNELQLLRQDCNYPITVELPRPVSISGCMSCLQEQPTTWKGCTYHTRPLAPALRVFVHACTWYMHHGCFPRIAPLRTKPLDEGRHSESVYSLCLRKRRAVPI